MQLTQQEIDAIISAPKRLEMLAKDIQLGSFITSEKIDKILGIEIMEQPSMQWSVKQDGKFWVVLYCGEIYCITDSEEKADCIATHFSMTDFDVYGG